MCPRLIAAFAICMLLCLNCGCSDPVLEIFREQGALPKRYAHLLKNRRQITEVWFSDSTKLKACLPYLKELPSLNRIGIAQVSLREEQLRVISRLDSVKNLELRDCGVNGAQLSMLKGMTQLKTLTLFGNPISDEDLRAFSELINLERLSLGNTQIDGSGIQHLRRCQKLRELNLQDTHLTDAGLLSCTQFPVIEQIGTNASNVTDIGWLAFLNAHSDYVRRKGPEARIHRERLEAKLNKNLQAEELDFDGHRPISKQWLAIRPFRTREKLGRTNVRKNEVGRND